MKGLTRSSVRIFSYLVLTPWRISSLAVTVPEGGVKEGQTFDAILATGGDDAAEGTWKVGLFDTCNLATALWWMGCCCSPILMGQVMQRLGLDFVGSKGEGKNTSTCAILTAATIVCSCVYFLRIPLYIFVLIFGVRFRMYMRKKYKIPAKQCGGDCMEDFCCVFWCTPCIACQTHRQTHDETQYKYACCSGTGLPDDAPSIV
jgi:Cys-rich protein (TIGR01571 family)